MGYVERRRRRDNLERSVRRVWEMHQKGTITREAVEELDEHLRAAREHDWDSHAGLIGAVEEFRANPNEEKFNRIAGLIRGDSGEIMHKEKKRRF